MKKTLYSKICFCLSLIFISCSTPTRHVVSAVEQFIAVDSTADAVQDSAYLAILQPKKDSMQIEMSVVVGHAPEDLTVGLPECTMLNWACDALYDMAVQVYDGQVDFSVVNIGGMRTNWQAGDITREHVFCLMPFDNRLVILTMQGSDILDLLDVFAKQGGQGVSRQLRMEINNKQAQNITLNGKPIIPEAVYYVVTSDYLSTGADHFEPLTKALNKYDTGLKIRDLYMDYIIQNKEVKSGIDGRMKVI